MFWLAITATKFLGLGKLRVGSNSAKLYIHLYIFFFLNDSASNRDELTIFNLTSNVVMYGVRGINHRSAAQLKKVSK